METTTVMFRTPHYVLLDGNSRIGPELAPSSGGMERMAIFGFANKDAYNVFEGHDHRALKPYPLVKDYLRIQVSAPRARLNLVVFDAAGPIESVLHAATMEAVLEAQENQTPDIAAAYRLIFDKQVDAYRVESEDA